MIDRSANQVTVKGLIKRIAEGTLDADLAIQRNFVWDEWRKSLLVHSVLSGYPIPQILVQDMGDNVLHLLDGKQRIGTMNEYCADGFSLSVNTPSVEDYNKEGNLLKTTEIRGMKFSDLTEEMRDRIRDFEFTVVRLKNLSPAVRDDIFLRINNGMPLTKMELTRVAASSGVMEYVNSIAERPFFAKVCNLTNNARKRFVDTELVLQTMYLVSKNGEAVDLDGNTLRSFVEDLKKNGVSDEFKEVMNQTIDYLEDVFTVKEIDLKKVHVPMIFLYAVHAIQSEKDVTPQRFGGWVQSFFETLKSKRGHVYSVYNPAASFSSARKEQVKNRINAMGIHFSNHVWTAEDYKTPEVKVVDPSKPKGKRGRPITDPKKLAAIEEQKRLDEQKRQEEAGALSEAV